MEDYPPHIASLATFRKFIGHLPDSWPVFLQKRQSRLAQQQRNGVAAEKVAENILEDFFTIALDWTIGDINNQLKYADLVLTKSGIKRLLIEVKRPGSLKWDQPFLEKARSQAWGYADEQRVRTIAVSDGTLFFAADIVNGGLKERARLWLDRPPHSPNAWWVSVDGIYRDVENLAPATPVVIEEPKAPPADIPADLPLPERRLHPKYGVPAECFAYVRDASNPRTWKLPYRLLSGAVDEHHLPGAIRSVVTNYRGVRATIPDEAIPDVLVRLGIAAAKIRKLPGLCSAPLATYKQLYDALYQIGRLEEVLKESS